jgi:hypothetical protein
MVHAGGLRFDKRELRNQFLANLAAAVVAAVNQFNRSHSQRYITEYNGPRVYYCFSVYDYEYVSHF